MKRPASAAKFSLTAWSMICCAIAIVVVLFAHVSSAQSVPYERTFPQSKAIVEKRLKELQSSSAGHLPALEGFTVPGDRPLDRFHRGYYQCTAQVSSTPSGGSTGASQRNHYRLVHRPVFRKGCVSGSSFQRPSGSRFPRPVAGSTGQSRVVPQHCAQGEPLGLRARLRCAVQSANRVAIQLGKSTGLGSHVFVGHPKGSDRSAR